MNTDLLRVVEEYVYAVEVAIAIGDDVAAKVYTRMLARIVRL